MLFFSLFSEKIYNFAFLKFLFILPPPPPPLLFCAFCTSLQSCRDGPCEKCNFEKTMIARSLYRCLDTMMARGKEDQEDAKTPSEKRSLLSTAVDVDFNLSRSEFQ